MRCFRCGRTLDNDDIGAYRKFCNREAEEFLCVPCFCTDLGCTETFLRDRIEFLRENGCLLFPPKPTPGPAACKGSDADGANRKE